MGGGTEGVIGGWVGVGGQMFREWCGFLGIFSWLRVFLPIVYCGIVRLGHHCWDFVQLGSRWLGTFLNFLRLKVAQNYLMGLGLTHTSRQPTL